MSALEALAVFLLVALPLHWVVQRQFAKLSDPRYLRDHGVVIVSSRALQGHSEPIGEYMGHPIWGSVTFMGLLYRFDHVAGPGRRELTAARELYLEPGLLYVTE